ncbi:uncharacterized protein LOC142990763 [Genypterus blacodes]|uniref:uncharacterized protein LOC142990763 n=1 Tax=Genypterus blacodes TaxID=154954 RepID=UPI003F768527
MACGTGAALLLVMISCVISAQDSDPLVVIYPKRSIRASIGEAVKLECSVEYKVRVCGPVRVVWQQEDREAVELTDPSRFLTVVSEEALEDGRTRRRQVVTEILRLIPRDAGTYQCSAGCESSEDTAVGHFISLTVDGQDGHEPRHSRATLDEPLRQIE